jgi:hypothetical protein
MEAQKDWWLDTFDENTKIDEHNKNAADLHEIEDGLFLGSVAAAKNKSVLEVFQIKAILTVADFRTGIPRRIYL